jgi:ABC-type multidrug transport system fused ATPase/permease subunit
MREMYELTKSGLAEINPRGRRVLLIFLISLVAIASLDGIALLLLSKLLSGTSTDNSDELISNSATMLVPAIVGLFILRSILSTISTWMSLKEFADQEVEIGQKRFNSLHNSSLDRRLTLNQSDYFTAVDRGPTSLVQGYLVSIVTACAEATSGLVILSVVLVLQPTTALVAFSYFVTIAIVQHKFLSGSQTRAGLMVFKSGNGTYDLLGDYYNMDKLLHVSESDSFESSLRNQRSALAIARAKQAFIASLPRYFMEAMLAFGFLLISGVTWVLSGEESVLPALVIFAAAGFRLLPIVNRIQGLMLSAIGYAPLAREALTPISLESHKGKDRNFRPETTKWNGELPGDSDLPLLSITNVSFKYPGGESDVVSGINLEIHAGLQYALVGPSGSGKTTLIDIILGLLPPDVGELNWNCQESELKLGYVPQDTHISSATVGGNVALEWDSRSVDNDSVRSALRDSQLLDHFSASLSNEEINSELENMSGGQRQRLGLARALYRNSNFLILDEATSALDAITESQVMNTVRALRGKSTVVIVAHRLSTIKNADQVIYLEKGKILGLGTFMDLQKIVPQFEEQVRLGNLDSINDHK